MTLTDREEIIVEDEEVAEHVDKDLRKVEPEQDEVFNEGDDEKELKSSPKLSILFIIRYALVILLF